MTYPPLLHSLSPFLTGMVLCGGLSSAVSEACENPGVIRCSPPRSCCYEFHSFHSVRRPCPSTDVPGVFSFPRVVGIVTERLTQEGKWIRVPDGEVSWSHDQLRYAPELDSTDSSHIRRVRMLKRPWDDSDTPWREFARSRPGELWAYGEPGVGEWAAIIEVQFFHGLPVWFPATSDE